MLTIENGSSNSSMVFLDTGDLAIVLLKPEWIQEALKTVGHLLPRINGLYFITTEATEKVKLRDIRIGWERVQRELAIFGPNVGRVLLMADTNTLRVCVPGLGKHGDMGDCHGSLFSLASYQLVPTWTYSEYKLKHMRGWMDRDLLRFEKLTKPTGPLPYTSYIPNTFDGHETVVVDLETSGLDAAVDHITALGVQWSETERGIITAPDTIAWGLQMIAASSCKNIVFHNAAFDLGFAGEQFRDQTYGRIRDTIVRSRARGELVNSLKHLGNVYTARPGNYSWVGNEQHDFTDPDYVCEDLDVTWRLYHLWSATSPIVELMERATSMVADQTAKGTAVDKGQLDTLAVQGALDVERLRKELTEKYDTDPGSTDALTSRLRELGYALSKQTKTGKDALTAEVLEEHGLLDILEFRKALKLDSAFVGKIRYMLREDGTLPHHQTLLGASTGRTTMKDFNHQQLPKKGPGKKLIVSRWPGGKIGNGDLKSAEVFTSCYYSMDDKLAAALRGPDMHRANAARGFNKPAADVNDDERFAAKALIFRSIFGGGPTNAAQERVHKYMTAEFALLFTWIERQKKRGQNDLKVVDVFGKVTNMLAKFDYAGKWACGRLGINAPVQGTSSHIAIAITLRIWELFRECKLRSLVLFGVHDSFVCDLHPEELKSATACIQQAFRDVGKWVAVFLPMIDELPLLCELQFGDSWADTKNGLVTVCSTQQLQETLF